MTVPGVGGGGKINYDNYKVTMLAPIAIANNFATINRTRSDSKGR